MGAAAHPEGQDRGRLSRKGRLRGLPARQPRAAPGPAPSAAPAALEILLWHPAKLSTLEIRTWDLVARGVQDVVLMSELLDVHRVSVSRTLAALRGHGLLRNSPEQPRHDGRFEGFDYEVLDADGNPLRGPH